MATAMVLVAGGGMLMSDSVDAVAWGTPHQVYFDAGSGTGAPSVQTYMADQNHVASVMMIPDETPVLERSHFVGWSFDPSNPDGQLFKPGVLYHDVCLPVDSLRSCTLYAVWSIELTFVSSPMDADIIFKGAV